MPDIARQALRERRRALAIWSAALAALVGLTLALWPTIRDDPNLRTFIRDLPPALRAFAGNGDFFSPAGYLGNRLFAVLVPVVFLALGIGRASDAIAGEEERGTLGLLLSSPISRSRLVLEKGLSVLVEVVLLGLVLWFLLAVGTRLVDMELPVSRLAAASVGAVLLGLVFAALALAVACLTGRRAVSRGAAGGLAAAAYFLGVFAPLVPALEPWREASPLYQTLGYEPLKVGVEPARLAVVVGATAVLVGVGIAAYRRRDLAG